MGTSSYLLRCIYVVKLAFCNITDFIFNRRFKKFKELEPTNMRYFYF